MKNQVKTQQHSIDVVKMEISALKRLIEVRERWLNKPENRLRSTYIAVYKDTLDMVDKLEELNEELQQLVNY